MIFHILDIHVNLKYIEGLDAHCPDLLCEWPPNPEVRETCPADTQHYNCKYPLWNFINCPHAARYWGDYICDIPIWTLDKTFHN